MTLDYRSVPFGQPITLKSLRDFILDTELTEFDTIILHQEDFDELALQFRDEYDEHLPSPYLLLGVLIREAGREQPRKGSLIVVENDTESIRVKEPEHVDPNKIIYRCGYCGTLVDENGGKLDSDEFDRNADYLNRFGNAATVHHRSGDCCRYRDQEDMVTPKVKISRVDFGLIAGKPLMELTEADFKLVGVNKIESTQFETIYSYQRQSLTKIYLTPNQDSYSIRRYRLAEVERVSTTEELIVALKKWLKA